MAAGDVIPWSYIATRVATGTITSDSGTWTGTETSALLTVSPVLVSGQRYAITVYASVSTSSVASPSVEVSVLRIREDSSSGTQLQGALIYLGTTNSNGYAVTTYAEYTAAADGAKSFVLTGQRLGGGGSHQIRAGGTRPTYMTVELIPS